MSASDSWKLLVFRNGRRVLHGPTLLRDLLQQINNTLRLSDFTSPLAQEELIEALLRAGELECTFADQQGCDREAKILAEISDELARALVGKYAPQLAGESFEKLSRLRVPEKLAASPPEGFCYYALHPLDYVDLLDHINPAGPAAIVGIRSIGTTLSAVVRAWFEVNGLCSDRITVRPVGHPFNRELRLTREQQQWVCQNTQLGARFFVVDEGPGLSGSSFLSVAEALVAAGVAPGQIVLLPSSDPDLEGLLADNANARWIQFSTFALKPTTRIPAEACVSIGAGTWREHVFANQQEWPAVWLWTERQKYLSSDRKQIFRFDGHGHYGKAVRQRAEMAAAGGWSPPAFSLGEGFSVSPWVTGVKPHRADRDTVIQLARYCAFRAQHFKCDVGSQTELEEMVRANLGRALGISFCGTLPLERPVIADARMMPYEWIQTPDSRLVKVDSATHGDDHFYPGPTDIAWDIAGAVVEWQLDSEAAQLLMDEYLRLSGDDINARIREYLIAYSAFRLAFAQSGGIAVPVEKDRFDAQADVYRTVLGKILHLSTAA